VFGGRIVDRGHKGESDQLAYAWDRHQPTAGHRSPRHAPHVGVDPPTAVITAVRAAIKPRMAAERPATPSLALTAWLTKAAVSARGSRIYGACKRGPAR
jgi:hypothetical protein